MSGIAPQRRARSLPFFLIIAATNRDNSESVIWLEHWRCENGGEYPPSRSDNEPNLLLFLLFFFILCSTTVYLTIQTSRQFRRIWTPPTMCEIQLLLVFFVSMFEIDLFVHKGLGSPQAMAECHTHTAEIYTTTIYIHIIVGSFVACHGFCLCVRNAGVWWFVRWSYRGLFDRKL